MAAVVRSHQEGRTVMSKSLRFTAAGLVAVPLALAAGVAWSQKPEPKPEPGKAEAPPADTGKHILVTPSAIQWADGPPSLPPGAKAAVVEGKPNEPGLFTMRVKLPANYKIPPHWHPADEHVTVLSGSFRMGVGEKFDEKALHDLPVGGFAVMAKGTRHFAMSKGVTVLQLHGIGPWGINYVNPADDPRQAAAKK
jgi:quercetin dioxygenase-like cupin family protein